MSKMKIENCSDITYQVVNCMLSIGEVPDGDDSPGTPVVALRSGDDISLSHGTALSASAYNLYRGTFTSLRTGVYDHNNRVNADVCGGDDRSR